jgi:hypothetical protein
VSPAFSTPSRCSEWQCRHTHRRPCVTASVRAVKLKDQVRASVDDCESVLEAGRGIDHARIVVATLPHGRGHPGLASRWPASPMLPALLRHTIALAELPRQLCRMARQVFPSVLSATRRQRLDSHEHEPRKMEALPLAALWLALEAPSLAQRDSSRLRPQDPPWTSLRDCFAVHASLPAKATSTRPAAALCLGLDQ